MNKLAVVLITKNQAWNIERLIESVLRATAGVASSEVWLVDSASTDCTVELAKQYPVNILRLRPDLPLTPAAGRYVGYSYSQSQYVLFLDGDMELYPDWLVRFSARRDPQWWWFDRKALSKMRAATSS